jgi:hypothetical protein
VNFNTEVSAEVFYSGVFFRKGEKLFRRRAAPSTEPLLDKTLLHCFSLVIYFVLIKYLL